MPRIEGGRNNDYMRAYTGHGMIEHHPANLTIAGVMGHELGHVNGARSLALMSGDTIVSQKIEMDLRFENGRLVAEGGRATTVVERETPAAAAAYKKNGARGGTGTAGNERAGASPETPGRTDDGMKNGAKNEKPSSSAVPGALSASDDEAKAKADNLSRRLSQEKSKLESELAKIENGLAGRTANAAEAVATEEAARGGETAPGTDGDENGEDKASGDAVKSGARAARLSQVKEKIARIENMMKSLEIAKSLEMMSKVMDSIVAATSTLGLGMAAASASNVAAAGNSTVPAGSQPGQSNASQSGGAAGSASALAPQRSGSSLEGVIKMIEAGLRGAMVNLVV